MNRHTVGSVMSMTPVPPGGRVQFRNTETNDDWDLPIVGWAVVVRWVAEMDADPIAGDVETEIEWVVISDGYVCTQSDMRNEYADSPVDCVGITEGSFR